MSLISSSKSISVNPKRAPKILVPPIAWVYGGTLATLSSSFSKFGTMKVRSTKTKSKIGCRQFGQHPIWCYLYLPQVLSMQTNICSWMLNIIATQFIWIPCSIKTTKLINFLAT
jgi:hypothetical protein